MFLEKASAIKVTSLMSNSSRAFDIRRELPRTDDVVDALCQCEGAGAERNFILWDPRGESILT